MARGPLLVSSRRDLSVYAGAFLGGRGLGEITKVGGVDALGVMVDCQLRAGSTRPWLCAEEELARQGYNTGAVDGRVDGQTVWLTYAFDKVIGFRPDAAFGELEWQRMLDNPRLTPRRPDLPPNHIEIDLARQLVLVVRDGQVRHALHTSTGAASTPTVRGVFTVYEKRNYRQANHMYRPVFFHRGYAFHGYPEIPLYPASHGCARMYDGDMDFLWPMLAIGDRVASY